MKTVWDYKVTFGYGNVPGYDGFHTGEDRTITDGDKNVPVTVNGVQIGIVGTTGKSTGLHLHVGKWSNAGHHDPKGGGKAFKSAVVTAMDHIGNTPNGKYVRVQGDGYSWVYLHLASIPANLKIGQQLIEEDDMYKDKTAKEWHDLYQDLKKRIIKARPALEKAQDALK